MFNIVLFNPQIPHNTGAIGRLCVNSGATLHLVKPLGFDISDKAVKRAGLDYWEKLDLIVWESIEEFFNNIDINKCHFATTKTKRYYFEVKFQDNDYFFFGREDAGLPEDLIKKNEKTCINIPMVNDARSLNIANAVSVIVYDVIRQNFKSFKASSKSSG